MSLDYTHLYKTISEVNRRRILAVLHGNECSVNDIQDVLTLGQSSISAHLAQLRGKGLVEFRRKGRFVLYRLSLGSNPEIDTFFHAILEVLPKEEWYERDAQRLKKLLKEKEELSLSFYEGVETQNKRSPGQTDHSLAIALLRTIKNKTIVDIGCGSGKLVREFARMNNKVIAIDAEKKQIALAKKMQEAHDNIDFIVGKGEDTKQENASIDLVIYSYSLHHIESPLAALQESARIIKKDGVLIILDLKKHDERWMKKIYGDVHLGFEPEAIHKMLQECGFNEIHIDFDASDEEFAQFESLIITARKK